jgi:hypothetical protein
MAMNEMIIVNESYVEVKCVPELKLIQIVWKGTFTYDQYKDAFIKSLDYQKAAGIPISNFLSDIRKQGVVNPDSRKWFEENALPRAVNQGLKRAAVVFDGNVFKKYYINIILQATNKFKLPFKFFSTSEDAIAWLKSFDD